jgi:hypothetical protein
MFPAFRIGKILIIRRNILKLVSPNNKIFDDALEDIGGVCLFDLSKKKWAKSYSFLRPYTKNDWHELGRKINRFDNKPAYFRFVDPTHERFGSIAKVSQNNRHFSWSQRDEKSCMQGWNARNSFIAELRWDKRSSRPVVNVPWDSVEYLPNYTGETVWAFDRDRKKRSERVIAEDRLGREIQVGDFITYILYQFDGGGAAGIYFGTVTKVEIDGSVWARNVGLSSKDKIDEKRIKENKLITILTEDLMRQLMVARLTNG